jgi:hypothetical protein
MFVLGHVIEFWDMKGDRRIQWTPFCLTCNWTGSDGTRAEAEHEAGMHERGERHPWQLAPGTARAWRPGDAAAGSDVTHQ